MELAPRTENDEVSDSVTNTILVDKRLDDSNKSSKLTKVVSLIVLGLLGVVCCVKR